MLGARFTQDCIENLFSNIRKKFPAANALQFKQSLKIHSISQYLQVVNNTNYEQDKGEFVVNFLEDRKRNENRNIPSEIPETPAYKISVRLDNVHLNILYALSGYIIHKISKLPTVCKTCINSAGSRTFDANIKYSKLVYLRCYRCYSHKHYFLLTKQLTIIFTRWKLL